MSTSYGNRLNYFSSAIAITAGALFNVITKTLAEHVKKHNYGQMRFVDLPTESQRQKGTKSVEEALLELQKELGVNPEYNRDPSPVDWSRDVDFNPDSLFYRSDEELSTLSFEDKSEATSDDDVWTLVSRPIKVTPEDLRDAVQDVLDEDMLVHKNDEELTEYVGEQVILAERLVHEGTPSFFAAAKAAFRALRMIPDPKTLEKDFRETLPDPVFKLVMDMEACVIEDLLN